MIDFAAGYQAYQHTSVNVKASGADIHSLVGMLFDGFLDELARTEGHIQAKRHDKKAASVEKLLKILGGLDASLDQDKGGEVAVNMHNLYQFCGQALLRASLRDNLTELADVRAVMTDLQQGWQALLQHRA
ncbi:flagellar export chaperone FliS [Rheinheimera sp.]|uniref:flagellar export chaperone FliS n=1 Tax=Rheinheimera sp. TaxID=1869214 RepID=UPI003AF82157